MFGIFDKIKTAFSKTSSKISESINEVFYKRKLDKEALEELETILLMADVGIESTNKILAEISARKFGKEVEPNEIKEELANIIEMSLREASGSGDCSDISRSDIRKPHIILMCGVNGNGKTTSIGKLANSYIKQNKKVMLAACDTFRAGATDQLEVWAKRVGCDIEIGKESSDPASVAYSAFAKAKDHDILFIDTAGRLQNHKNLMEELKKISNTISKLDSTAPHEVLMVLDATTGQNAISQLQAFKDIVPISGLIIAKLDGTAKAGIVISLAEKFRIPIKYAAIGEGIDDIMEFNAKIFARSLVGF
jgi:fused signal recognition particle receptor